MLDGYATAEGLITIGYQDWTDYEVQTSSLVLPTFPDNTAAIPETSIVFRYNDPSNYYWAGLGLNGHFASICKMVNYAFTELAYVGLRSEVQFSKRYILKAKVVGNTIELYVDGALVLTTSDPANSHTSGGIGLRVYGSHAQFDYISAVSPSSPMPNWLLPLAAIGGIGAAVYWGVLK